MDALKTFQDKLEFRGSSPNTIRQYSFIVKNFLDFTKKKKDFTKSDVEGYILHLKRKGVGANTQKLNFDVIHILYKALGLTWAFERREHPKTAEPERPFFTYEEMKKLLKTAKRSSKRGYALLRLSAATGARREEIQRLNRKDFKEGKLKTVKHGNPRFIDLDPETHRALDEYIKTRDDKDSALFVGKRGRLSTTMMTMIFKGIREEAGIRKKTGFHGMRRGMVTMLHKEGMSEKEITELMGWRTSTMVHTYIRLTPGEVHEKFKKIHPFYK